jgi:hypothetical protein
MKLSDVHMQEKKHIFIVLTENAKSTSLGYVIWRVFSHNSLLLIGHFRSQEPFDSHWLDECANSTPAYLTIDQSYATYTS